MSTNIPPAIILMQPQMGENIGATARAMLNFGLTDLRLVAPRDGWPNEAAIQNAAGALDQINVQIFDTLPDALADLHFTFATTARPRDMVKPVYELKTAINETKSRSAQDQKIGFVFGRERTGLENDDIALCSATISIPVNPDFPSINLAQAVLLIAYEYFMQHHNTPTVPSSGNDMPVSHENLMEFLTRLESELDTRKFFRSEGLKPTMIRNIQNMFTRADLTDQEVRTLQGMLSALIGNKLT